MAFTLCRKVKATGTGSGPRPARQPNGSAEEMRSDETMVAAVRPVVAAARRALRNGSAGAAPDRAPAGARGPARRDLRVFHGLVRRLCPARTGVPAGSRGHGQGAGVVL